MANAYSTMQVSTIYAPTNEYQVLMRVAPQYQDRPDALSLLYVRSAQRRARAARRAWRASSRASGRSRSTTPGRCRR